MPSAATSSRDRQRLRARALSRKYQRALRSRLVRSEEARDIFYRGRNRYPPVDVGYASPDLRPVAYDYFKFDTATKGN